MRSCELYQESLLVLKGLLLEKDCRRGAQQDIDRKLARLCEQVKDDTILLKEIVKETKSVATSTAQYSVIVNALTTLITGREENLKELEKQLMARVQGVTLMLSIMQVLQLDRLFCYYFQTCQNSLIYFSAL